MNPSISCSLAIIMMCQKHAKILMEETIRLITVSYKISDDIEGK